MALIVSLLDQLRGHIRGSPQNSFEETASVTALDWRREPKVSESNVVLSVEHHVLRLQISVAETFDVHVVHNLKHLFEIVATNICRKSAQCDVVEKLPSLYKCKHHIGNLKYFAIRFYQYGVFFVFNETYHVGMIKVLVHIDFVF